MANHFDEINASGLNVNTSLFALCEIINGIDGTNYHQRKVLLSKIKKANLKIFPYTPRECIALAFHLDINTFSSIQEEKRDLWRRIEAVSQCDSFDDYAEFMQSNYHTDVRSEKNSDDRYEAAMKTALSNTIVADRQHILDLKTKQQESPEYYHVQVEDILKYCDKEASVDLNSDEGRLLTGLLDNLKLTYAQEDVERLLKERDRSALVSAILGIQMYSGAKAFEFSRTLSGRNDPFDLMHLLYLRNENYLIVSDDKIFDYVTMVSMRIKNEAFLKLCRDSQ